MQYLKVAITAAFIAGATAGCTGTGNLDALRARAAFDFQCPADTIQLTQLAEGQGVYGMGAVYGASGCGRRGTYVRPPGSGPDTWVLNSAEQGAAGMGQPPP